ncbi:unnamed protein product, partial [Darwinula stevensoni]
MALVMMEKTSDRVQDVLFSSTLGEGEFSILVKRPGQTHKSDALLAPFDTTVWILILVASIAMGPLIWALMLLASKMCKEDQRFTRLIPITSCVWFVYGALLKQGSPLQPKTG